jgi:hypothetical protein
VNTTCSVYKCGELLDIGIAGFTDIALSTQFALFDKILHHLIAAIVKRHDRDRCKTCTGKSQDWGSRSSIGE